MPAFNRLALPAALTLALACSDNSPIGPGPVVEVQISPGSTTLDLGQSLQFRGLPLDASHALLPTKKVTWASSDPNVATVDTTGLAITVGLGTTDLSATSDGITGTATLTVSNPDIALDQAALNFVGSEGGGDPAAQTVNVTSARGGALGGLGVGTIIYGAGATGWLGATLDQATAPATLTVQPVTGALVAGTYTASVPVTSAAAGNSPQVVAVTYIVNPPGPAIFLTPGRLNFGATVGGADPAAQTVAVTNVGGGTLNQLAVGVVNYGAGASGWVTTATLDVTTAPATLTVQLSTTGLAAGSYSATVPISSPVAGNSPQTVTLNFTLNAVSLANDVQPIFTSHCTACHTTAGQVPDLSAGNSFAAIVGVVSITPGCSGRTYVVAGNAATSLVYQKVLVSTPPCGGHMPPGGQLNSTELQIISDWITAGAPNN